MKWVMKDPWAFWHWHMREFDGIINFLQIGLRFIFRGNVSMDIGKLRIKNYRSYEDSGLISIDEKMILLGENNAGKSNILRAIDMFLDISPTKPHEIKDFHRERTEEDIEIEMWFDNLSEKETEIFNDYISEGELYVKTIYPFNEDKKTVVKKKFIVKKSVPAIDEFRNLDKSADKMKEIYKEHEDKLEEHRIEDWSGNLYKNEIKPTIKNYLNSGDAEYEEEEVKNPSGIKKKLRKNLPEFQYFEASRSIDEETKTSTNALLGRLLSDTFDSVPEDQKQSIRDALGDIDRQLNEEDKFEEIKNLEDDIKDKLNQQVPISDLNLEISVPDLDTILENVDISVKDGVETDIENMGAGLHTSFILACLWQLSEQEGSGEDVIFGLEEPENDLHPHAERHLYDTLDKLADKEYQVFLSTHSAFLIDTEDVFDAIRVENEGKKSAINTAEQSEFSNGEITKIKSKINPKNNEMFFSKAVLLVEGESEQRVLPILNSMLHESNDGVYAFDRLGISLIDVEGKTGFESFLKLLNMFNLTSIVMIDNDREVDEGHEKLVNDIETKADKLIELPDDLEHQFFKAITLEQFCKAMKQITEYDHSPENLRHKKEGKDLSKVELLEEEFDRVNPPKPKFGELISKEINVSDVPEDIRDVVEECKRAI